MNNYNFDEVIDRRNTDSLKYDFAIRRGMSEDILPLWVADMDFPAPKEVMESVVKRVEHGIFGYSEVQESYFNAIRDWMKLKHNWDVDKKWLVKTPGVVFALAMAVQAFTKPGDSVILQSPVYYPFFEVIEDNDRKVIDNTLILKSDGKYHIDFDDFEKKVVEYKVKLFLFCSPHNPVGRVWTKEELKRLGDICLKHDVLIISDEIHEDFVFHGKHCVFANLSKELSNRTITLTAPSKTFNLAGMQVSNIFISNPNIRYEFRKQVGATGYSQLNTLGLVACEAAYNYGADWHKQLMKYLKGNLDFVRNYLKDSIPKVSFIKPEGTYLVWLDFRKLNLSDIKLEELIVKKAGLWLDRGELFGETGKGFERVNIACPRAILDDALKRLSDAINNL